MWIMIFSLVASAAGAAAGTVLSGQIDAGVNMAVGHPLKVEKPTVSGLAPGHQWFGAVSDQSTEFSAAVQLYQGEAATINVPVVNLADNDHVVEIVVTAPVMPVPPGGNQADYNINLDVDGSGLITDVVRVGAYKWKATVPGASQGSAGVPSFDGISIIVALGTMVPPGYYAISGQMTVVPY